MSLLTETYEGSPDGMNLAQPAHALSPTQARYIQDGLLDHPGLTRRRGPVKKVAATSAMVDKASGIVHTLNPAGASRIALLAGTTSSGYLNFLNDNYSPGSASSITRALNVYLPGSPPSNPYKLVDIKQARGGGALIGVSATAGITTDQALLLWRGSRKVDTTTGTVGVTKDSKVVTGAGGTTWLSTVEPGMFLFLTALGNDAHYVGTVKSVDSNTQVTLEQAALVTGTASGLNYAFRSKRGIVPRVMKGRITCTTGSAIVTGANTKFKDQKVKDPSADTWLLFRMTDNAYIGTISSVQSNSALTLAANAGQALSNERYFAVNISQNWDTQTNAVSLNSAFAKVGFLHAVYAERQWYANNGRDLDHTSRVWFSDPLDLEGLDLSPADGDFINIGAVDAASGPIRALSAAYNALLVLKEDSVWAIRGSSPSTFAPTKLHDDGCMSPMAVQPYAGGVIWPGRNGIHFYDGVEVNNLTENRLGDYYKDLLQSLNPGTYRMWSMMARDHYFLFLENVAPPIAVTKGLDATTPSQMTIVINMATKAISFAQNLNIRGAINLPADSGESAWYAVNAWPTTLTEQGNTGAPTGYTPEQMPGDRMIATKVTVTGDRWVPRLHAYLDGGVDGAVGNCKVKLALYTNNAGVPDALVGATEAVEVAALQRPEWVAFDFVEGKRIAAGTYFLVALFEKSNHVNMWSKANAGMSFALDRDYEEGFANPFGTPHATNNRDKDYAMKLSVAATSTISPYLCDASALFDADDRDEFGCDSGTPGPDFYYESRKFNAGDSLRKKLFKHLSLHYMAQGGALKLDTVTGLNELGQTRATVFPATTPSWNGFGTEYGSWTAFALAYAAWDAVLGAVFKARRLRFLKRSTHLSFRLYQASPLMTQAKLGPFQIGFKLQRPGRL